MEKIKQTSNIKASITDKLKLLAGKPVEIGKNYNKITVLSSSFADEVNKTSILLTAMAYIDNRLILADGERKYFVFLTGDMSDFGGTLIAEHILTSIRFNQPITKDTTLDYLRNHYHYIPPNLLKLVIQSVQ